MLNEIYNKTKLSFINRPLECSMEGDVIKMTAGRGKNGHFCTMSVWSKDNGGL